MQMTLYFISLRKLLYLVILQKEEIGNIKSYFVFFFQLGVISRLILCFTILWGLQLKC